MSKFPYMPGLSQPAPDFVTITRKEHEQFIAQDKKCAQKIMQTENDCMASLKQMERIVKEDAYHGKIIRLMIGFVIGFLLGAIAYSIMLKLFM